MIIYTFSRFLEGFFGGVLYKIIISTKPLKFSDPGKFSTNFGEGQEGYLGKIEFKDSLNCRDIAYLDKNKLFPRIYLANSYPKSITPRFLETITNLKEIVEDKI